MKQNSQPQTNGFSRFFSIESLLNPRNFKSFKNYVLLVPFFLLLPLAYLIKNLFRINVSDTFILGRMDIDIISLYHTSTTTFIVVTILEGLVLVIAVLISVYFILFVRSIDIEDPFKNEMSKHYITRVAAIGVYIFILDLIIRLLIQDVLMVNGKNLHVFNIEYLIMVNFFVFFAVLFRKGVDLKNEINLVV